MTRKSITYGKQNSNHFRISETKLKTYKTLNKLRRGDGELELIYMKGIGFGGLEVACWPLVPKFAGSNPAEAVGFLSAKKSSARLPLEGK